METIDEPLHTLQTLYSLRVPDLTINNSIIMSGPDFEKTLGALLRKHHVPSRYLRLIYDEKEGYLLIHIEPNGNIILDVHYVTNTIPDYVKDLMLKKKKGDWIFFPLHFYDFNMRLVIDKILEEYEAAVHEFLEVIPDELPYSIPEGITKITAMWGKKLLSVPYDEKNKHKSVYALMLKIVDKARHRPTKSFNYAIDFRSPLITNWKLNHNGKGTLNTYTLLQALRKPNRLGQTEETEKVLRRVLEGRNTRRG
jgi:hypothetical protein